LDEARVRRLLEELSGRIRDRAILWRGDELSGSDVDLVALPGAEAAIAVTLAAAGLEAERRVDGRVMWSAPDGSARLDVMPASAWPPYYPSLSGVGERARPGRQPLPVASEEDRLLILAADAVAGRPMDKLTRRMRPLLEAPGVSGRLEAVARKERRRTLAALAARPDRLESRARRGRLPYPAALAAAARSRAARAALRARVSGRAASLRSSEGQVRAARHDGLLVALSGMDGSGKSSAARAVAARLAESGRPSETAWARLGVEELRDRVSGPIKRLLRYRGTVADPVASSPAAERPPDAGARAGRRSLVAWTWIPVVAAIAAYSHRLAARPRHKGTSVVCDRWLVDSLVDLRVRYGRHRMAERILTVGTPRPDLSILLEIDAPLSAERKPGDQVERILREMEALYAELAERHGLTVVDARAPKEDVEAQVRALVEPLLGKLKR